MEPSKNSIYPLNKELEDRISRNPLLNIDTFIIPTPFVKNPDLKKDYLHSSVYIHEGELLGYILVYSDPKQLNFLIYKVVTSPFGRGKGIGSLLIENLTSQVPIDAMLHLFVWMKQLDTMEFFTNMGFQSSDSIVYRNLIYQYLSAHPSDIVNQQRKIKLKSDPAREKLGKTRHDARKVVRLLSSMVEKLALENCGRIIEDINRETTGLVNVLNSFRDSIEIIHEVDLMSLILDRIIPFIDGFPLDCDIAINKDSGLSVIRGSYVEISRALINLVSNSLEAIAEKGEAGQISFTIRQSGESVHLIVADNGCGMDPDLLIRDELGYPAFVGKTTKQRKKGEGMGTTQIFSTVGVENIEIMSTKGMGTTWQLSFQTLLQEIDRGYISLERRFYEFTDLTEGVNISKNTPARSITAAIWYLRKMEIFMFDLIMQFSIHHNIRDIYRLALNYLQGYETKDALKESIAHYSSEYLNMKSWLYEIIIAIKNTWDTLEKNINMKRYRGPLFKSYGQAVENIMIFTLDPETGNVLVTDRKLAEHLDFAIYLKKERDQLLRGEFMGDLNNVENPVLFGVWSIDSDTDLMHKLKLIQKGAKRLVEIGIPKTKRLSFYQTTYCNHSFDINPDKATTFREFIQCSETELQQFIREADEEMQGYIVYRD
jgi:N-acetylglutamate synthase-like GNAT family acetyltransferase/two-component sensor histidine kinase